MTDQHQLLPHCPSGMGHEALTPLQAAYRRILSQDLAYIRSWGQQNAITHDLQAVMHGQLARLCGATFETIQLYAQEGAQLVQKYPALDYEIQVQWLITDLSARQDIQALDLKRTAEPNFRRAAGALNLADDAILYRVRINAEQIAQLMHMLSAQPAGKVAEIRVAMYANKVISPRSPETNRTPLAQKAPNVPSMPASSHQTKRKREDDDSSSHRANLPRSDNSDDENALQGEANALQARIAAIQARTAHEDAFMPAKKAKRTSQKAVKPELLPQITSTSRPICSNPPSSSTPSMGALTHTIKPPVSMPPQAAPAAQYLKLILKRQGKPDFRCKAALSTSVAKIITTARKYYGISADIETCLHLKGQRLSAAELLGEAGLHDFVTLDVLDLPKSEKCDAKKDLTFAPKVEERKLDAASTVQFTAKAVVDLTSSSPIQVQPEPSTAPQAPVQTEPPLCQEQQEVVDAILAGRNVFYTGSAGCGKSTVLKAFVPRLREMGKTVRIVAPTGKAALDINGSTTWTYAGWTPTHMKRPLEDLVKAAHGKFVSKRFKSTDVLVIDEISMVENHLLARLNAIMKAARGKDRPFGGVQLVVTGDFCQLPPVKPFAFCMNCGREQARKIGLRGETLYRCPKHGDCNDDDKWAFRSKVWEECNFVHVNLSSIHRQSDQVFISILQKLRIGKPLTNADRKLLLDHPCDVKNAVKLFPTREEVRRINQTEFDQLKTAKRDYRCLDYFSWNQEHGNLLGKGRRSPIDDSLEALREHRLDNLVEFKAGMLVVLLVNLDITNGLVNGSQGRVIGFEPFAESKLPKATTRESESFSSFSRGGSSSKNSRRGRGSPEPSQAAVQGELRGEYAALRETQIRDFILQPRNQNKMWPIVEFDNGLRRTIYADCQVNELGDEKPYTLLARTQIPLLAAWAMTIHKSQGMTLDRVIVDLGRSFEEGQEYVALSRARSLDGLQVLNLGNNIKGGNEQVKAFLKQKFNIG
ncbi:putative pif1/Herpes helicase domain, DNA helicase Pif1 [Septoria linicola]|nr:putative pif1/Herpes helicase domain, DNA helicase Pif1 [Septoria linicola]